MRNYDLSEIQVKSEAANFSHLRNQLIKEIPDIDPETLADTLEGITDLREMLSEVVRSALVDEALASGLSTRMSEMKARHERLEVRARRKRELALKAMAEAEIPKLASVVVPAVLARRCTISQAFMRVRASPPSMRVLLSKAGKFKNHSS